MKDFFITVISSATVLFIASMTVSLGNIIHAKCQQIKQQTQNKAFKDFISKIDYVVQLAVEATNQTFVIDKKLESDFTEEAKDKAFDITFDSIETMLTDEDKQTIIDNFGDMSSFIKNSIETYIKQSKN